MALGRAKLAMGQGVSVWVLEAHEGFGDAHFHAHHAIQITLSLSGALMLADQAATMREPAIAVAADAPHRFEAHGLLVFIFVEPESRAGRALDRMLFAGASLSAIDAEALEPLVAPLRATFEPGLDTAALLAAGRAVVEQLAPGGPVPLPDDRIRRVIEQATARPDRSLESAAMAAGVHLSPSRLRHLFVEQTGLAFKTYQLWLRLVRAIDVYAQGASLTEAAHQAGFSDSAHFSRTFKRTFGLPATTLERF